MRTIAMKVTSHWEWALLTLALLVGGATLPSGVAAADDVDRRCVCIEGSGGCGPYYYWCCDFEGSSYTCGCVFLGLGGTCTNTEL